jgi:hypothetical protein
MSNRKKYISIWCFFWVSFGAKAQLNNTNFETFSYIDSTNSKRFQFHFESFNFLKNNEYFNNIADGYTLVGNQFLPKVSYQPSPHIIVETGVYAWKDFGNNVFSLVQPIFTIRVQKDSSQFIFGNLTGNLNHRLIEPLFNFERVILNRQESGIQYTRRKKNTFFDTWLDWEKMIYKGSEFKEEIFAGVNWNKKIISNRNFNFSIPVQMTIKHRGGQIDKDTSQVTTNLNLVLGIEAEWRTKGLLQTIRTQNYWLSYRQNASSYSFLPQGSSVYLNLTAETKIANFMISYWNTSGFNSDEGGDLYQSIGRVYRTPNIIEKERKLLIFRVMKDWKLLDNLLLSFRFEPYFDFINKKFEHSEGLYLMYRQSFKLK